VNQAALRINALHRQQQERSEDTFLVRLLRLVLITIAQKEPQFVAFPLFATVLIGGSF
jgi:hypothetical protein